MPPDTDSVLTARARRAALRPPPVVETCWWIAFEVGGRRHAIRAAQLAAVETAAGLRRLPVSRPPLAGVLLRRGRPLTVLDAHALFGLPPAGLPPAPAVLVLSAQGLESGLLVDRLIGLHPLDASLKPAPLPPPPGAALPADALALGPDEVVLVDAAVLLAHPALIVRDG